MNRYETALWQYTAGQTYFVGLICDSSENINLLVKTMYGGTFYQKTIGRHDYNKHIDHINWEIVSEVARELSKLHPGINWSLHLNSAIPWCLSRIYWKF